MSHKLIFVVNNRRSFFDNFSITLLGIYEHFTPDLRRIYDARYHRVNFGGREEHWLRGGEFWRYITVAPASFLVPSCSGELWSRPTTCLCGEDAIRGCLAINRTLRQGISPSLPFLSLLASAWNIRHLFCSSITKHNNLISKCDYFCAKTFP